LNGGTNGSEKEGLAEHPDLAELLLGLVFSPSSETGVTEEDNSNELGFSEGSDLSDDGHGNGHDKAGDELQGHAALVLWQFVEKPEGSS
jgi:hypothetical protein